MSAVRPLANPSTRAKLSGQQTRNKAAKSGAASILEFGLSCLSKKNAPSPHRCIKHCSGAPKTSQPVSVTPSKKIPLSTQAVRPSGAIVRARANAPKTTAN